MYLIGSHEISKENQLGSCVGFEVLRAVVMKNSLPSALTLTSCSAYSSTLKMEAICSSETLVDFQRTTWRYIPEDSTLQLELEQDR
jgi:hypothetical protein